MANKLVFPIEFDVQGGAKNAERATKDFMERIERITKQKPITINTSIKAGKDLVAFKAAFKSSRNEIIADINAIENRWNSMSFSEKFYKTTGNLRPEARDLLKQYDQLNLALDTFGRKISDVRDKTKKANQSFREQTSYVERLIQRLAVYTSLGAITSFLGKVREVTAQMELQRISLGAIIQDQDKANQILSEIKSFAVQSPVKLFDLTKYTKQLAAYRIETDKLFDTTKRLADVSVGLGVDMERLIMAYGKTKSTNVLNAIELRQFGMMGIPMLELVAQKMSDLQNKTISTSEAFDMIKKRMVGFDVVEQIFEDMTNKGGIFYDMQVKQGNTLYGMWQKLGDAATIMYDQIGNTKWINEGMKDAISLLRSLMLNWERTGGVLGSVVVAMIAYMVQSKRMKLLQVQQTAAHRAYVASLEHEVAVRRRQIAMTSKLTWWQKIHNKSLLKSRAASLAAAQATGIFRVALLKLKAALLANPLGLIIAALGTLAALFWPATDAADKLSDKLSEINTTYANKSREMKDNFKELADTAVNSIDGSKRQKEALDELNRTYGQIIGSENLQIEKLRALEGAYEDLNNIIEAYNIKRRGDERETAIKDIYGESLSKLKKEINDLIGLLDDGETKQARFWDKFNQYISNGFSAVESMKKALKDLLGTSYDVAPYDSKYAANLRKYATMMDEMNSKIDQNRRETTDAANALDGYTKEVVNLQAAFAQLDWSSLDALKDSKKKYNAQHKGNIIELPVKLTFHPDQAKNEVDRATEQANLQLQAMYQAMEKKVAEYGKKLPKTFYTEMKSVVKGNKSFSIMNFDALNTELEKWPQDAQKALQPAFKQFKQMYEQIVPTDRTVRVLQTKLRQVAEVYKVLPENAKQYLIRNEEDISAYADRIKESIESLEKDINELALQRREIQGGLFGGVANKEEIDAIDTETTKLTDEVKMLKALFELIASFAKGSKGKGGDQRLSILKEMASDLQKINKEYEDLLKKESSAQALADTQEIYADTLKRMQDLAKKYKFELPEFEVPTNAKSLTAYLESIKKAMAKLPKSDKDVLGLTETIGKINVDEVAKRLEEQLKQLEQRISQTKTAKEFFDKILAQSGDYELAVNMTMNIYGETGAGLQKEMAEQLQTIFGSFQAEVPVGILAPDNKIDYTALQKYLDENKDIPEKQAEQLRRILTDGQKNIARLGEDWVKTLEKSNSYAQKRLEILQKTTNAINAIRERGYDDPATERQLISAQNEKQMQDLAKLEYEAFKDTPLYIQMFENLDLTATSTLNNMRDKLIALRNTWGTALSPNQVREMQKRLMEIESQLRERNPFKALTDSIKNYKETLKGLTLEGALEKRDELNRRYAESATKDPYSAETQELKKQLEVQKRIAEISAQLVTKNGKRLKGQQAITRAIEIANDKQLKAQKELDDAQAEYNRVADSQGKDSPAAKAAWEEVKAKEKALELATLTANAVLATSDASAQLIKSIASVGNFISGALDAASDLARNIGEMIDLFGGAEEDVQLFNDIADALGDISAGVGDIVKSVMSGDIMGIVTNALAAPFKLIKGFFNLSMAGTIRKANKEIKRQQSIIDSLEYSYSRLEKAMEKSLGSDYISNHKQQLATLEAQRAAYLKQYNAEMSKGKKADKDKLQGYADAARDIADQIKDMEDEVVNYLAGTDITSAARDFANAWLDAYVSFESTTDAIREKFQDMIKNMIIESMAAKLVESLLSPVYEEISRAAADSVVTEDELANITDMAIGATEQINSSMLLLMESLKQAGLDVRDVLGDKDKELTGISRNIASASEESINGLAAGINTQNFYMSYVPQISADVAAIRAYVVGDPALAATEGVNVIDLVTMQNSYLQHLPTIAANTAATVERCERAALACETMVTMLGRVIKPRGTQAAHSVSVAMS